MTTFGKFYRKRLFSRDYKGARMELIPFLEIAFVIETCHALCGPVDGNERSFVWACGEAFVFLLSLNRLARSSCVVEDLAIFYQLFVTMGGTPHPSHVLLFIFNTVLKKIEKKNSHVMLLAYALKKNCS